MSRGLDVRPTIDPEALAPSTDRTFALLELLSQYPDGLSIAQITRQLGVAQNSVFRITKTLEARGYLTRRDRDKCYLLTDKLLHIAQPKVGGKNLVEESLPVMKQLRDETTESVVLTVRSGHEGVLILQIPALHVMKIMWDLGIRTPLYNNAPGKLFLALADEPARRRLISQQEFTRWTERTITDERELAEHLLKVREQGYAVDRGEYIEGIHCVAAPVFALEGEMAAAICVSGPAARIPARSFSALGKQVIEAADRITDRLRSS
jgi:DNA-binding IclR family transcriptional regulator